MRNLLLSLIVILSSSSIQVVAGDAPVEPKAGPWRAWLDCPGGELPFGLDLQRDGDSWTAWLINGRERIAIATTVFRDGQFVINIEHYDSRITAVPSAEGTRMDGHWVKTGSGGRESKLAFHATAGDAPRFAETAMMTIDALRKVEGRWAVKFTSTDEPAIGEFVVKPGGVVEGTFLSPTGDYGFLAGSFERNRLRLSNFDGAHAFLFEARLVDDGTLKGDFWSRDAFHDTWTAKRAPGVGLPDEFELTKTRGKIEFDKLSFPDVEGRIRSLADADLAGRARIIELFGTWCPNCHDASEVLADLHNRYHDKGLSIVGLAFELTGESARDARQVRRYVERHKVGYPVLIAGVSDKAKAAAALPFLEEIKGYPTTIFTDAAGNVVAVHTGFSGPATGEAHQRLRKRFDEIVRKTLELSLPDAVLSEPRP